MVNIPEPKMKILEAMSFIYEVFLKSKQYGIEESGSFHEQLVKAYNDLQLLRDDSLFISVEEDLNDQFVKKQKQKRIDELISPPFNVTKKSWIK